ncbi:MAG: HlyD family efflux transporter periplasmic adaptor subunit [Patescibacteria group bacterium]|nr:HlyD family efflux transporter periplasmic adaptor subunit [Patescibacteria group bacterium]
MAEQNTTPKASSRRSVWIRTGVIVFIIIAASAGIIYWRMQSAYVYIDTAMIEAPIINLAPTSAGVLQQVFVNEGDSVPANAPVAQVGNEIITSQVAGLIVNIPDQIGAQITPGEAVVEMIDPTQLRVVGTIDEDKGLSRIQVGDKVSFTVDAFGGKQYTAVVDEISPTSAQTQIIFNISAQRQEQQFYVKGRFDINAYPELKNGMSARMWVYTTQ